MRSGRRSLRSSSSAVSAGRPSSAEIDGQLGARRGLVAVLAARTARPAGSPLRMFEQVLDDRLSVHCHTCSITGAITAPTPAAQRALLAQLRQSLDPILSAEKLPTTFVVEPGVRLSRAYGRCTWKAGRDQPSIAVRCTADGDRTLAATRRDRGHAAPRSRPPRYRSHGPRFWALHRRLVDRAAGTGLYDPTDRDPDERGRGDEKLAASAAKCGGRPGSAVTTSALRRESAGAPGVAARRGGAGAQWVAARRAGTRAGVASDAATGRNAVGTALPGVRRTCWWRRPARRARAARSVR